MPYDEKSAEAEAGRRGEAAVDEWVRKHLGYARLQVSDMGRKAVFIDSNDHIHAAYDRLYMHPAGSRWVDVKWKTAPDHYRILDCMRHGIDLPAWHNYLKMAKISGIGGDLAIIEVKRHVSAIEIAPVLLWQSVRELKKRITDAHHQIVGYECNGFPYGAIFWNVDDFENRGSIGIGTLPLPPTRRNVHPWEQRDRFGDLRIPPLAPRQAILPLFDQAGIEEQ